MFRGFPEISLVEPSESESKPAGGDLGRGYCRHTPVDVAENREPFIDYPLTAEANNIRLVTG